VSKNKLNSKIEIVMLPSKTDFILFQRFLADSLRPTLSEEAALILACLVMGLLGSSTMMGLLGECAC
jgi:hypothetical protein